MVEIRLHGRGGQGGVTCAKILAATYARLGKFVQTFGDYASERSGAPVRAYTRVSDQPITNRNKVYDPDHLVVLDPYLLGDGTVEGLAHGGTLLVNTAEAIGGFEGRFERHKLAVVEATEIARSHRIGTRSVVIVNTTIAGAFARLHDLPLDILEEAYRSLGFLGNFGAAREAYEAVRWRDPMTVDVPESKPDRRQRPPSVPVEPLQKHVESPPSGLATGAWSRSTVLSIVM